MKVGISHTMSNAGLFSQAKAAYSSKCSAHATARNNRLTSTGFDSLANSLATASSTVSVASATTVLSAKGGRASAQQLIDNENLIANGKQMS